MRTRSSGTRRRWRGSTVVPDINYPAVVLSCVIVVMTLVWWITASDTRRQHQAEMCRAKGVIAERVDGSIVCLDLERRVVVP